MNIFTASDFRQIANQARVTTRKGLRVAIRHKTDTAMDFVMLQNLLHRNASKCMQPSATVPISNLRKGTDLAQLEFYLKSCHLTLDIGDDKIKVSA